jgi:hypothetical protein
MVQTPVTTVLMNTALTPLRGTSDHPHFNVLTPCYSEQWTHWTTEEGEFVCKYVASLSCLCNVYTLTALLHLEMSNKFYASIRKY